MTSATPGAWEDDDQGVGMVRPYARTGGRTRPTREFAIEAMVVSIQNPVTSQLRLRAEHAEIVQLCRGSRSVAEVSALLGVPLGVSQVLLGDMVEMGLVVVHERPGGDERPDTALMERVLNGLRRL